MGLVQGELGGLGCGGVWKSFWGDEEKCVGMWGKVRESVGEGLEEGWGCGEVKRDLKVVWRCKKVWAKLRRGVGVWISVLGR